ncbi:MAG: type 1 glutamine amidotransferase [Thermoleophilia bacterium]|nr:type 1 glutamine amidotransferase [Thermoleophilia bacterium]
MRVLSITHEPGPYGGGGEFERAATAAGHALDVWLTVEDAAPPAPVRDYGAVMVFGGAMHPDQDDEHPWLAVEVDFIREALAERVPLLGVCLGAQLIARAAGAQVGPADRDEVGWHDIDLTEAGVCDPVLGGLPTRFSAFEWHHYTWELPAGAELLAASGTARQAFRLGDRTWAVQFHPEVNNGMLNDWFSRYGEELPMPRAEVLADTALRLPRWVEQGRALVEAFLREAERA